MKKIYLSLLTIIFAQALNAQCTALALYPSGAVTPTAAWTDVNGCNFGGEYALVNVTAGNLYEFSTCATNGSTITFDSELTLRTNTGAVIAYSDDYCGTQSYVSWTATYTGQVQIHLHVYPCASNSICSNIRMKVTSSVPVPAPANNDCVNASNLNVNATCLLTSGTTSGATEDLIPDPSCDPGNINDVWYTFNSGPNTSVNITVNLVTASWIGIEMFTACGTLAPGISLGGVIGNCDWNTSAPNPTVASGLTPNTVYRFRLFTNVTYDIAGSFTVCLTIPPPPPPPTVSINSASICPGALTTLTATPSTLGGTYLWSPGGQTTQSITVSPLTTTTYSVTYTLNGVGTNNSTVTVFTPPAINAGLDISICSGAQATLSGTGGVSYSWDNGVTNNLAFNPLNTATYTVTGTDLNGCTNTDQVLVTVNLNPTVNGGLDQTVCVGGSAILSGSGAATYTWSGGVTNGVAFAPTVTSTYTVTGTNSAGCTGTDQVTINVTPGPVAAITGAAPTCLGSQVTLTASPMGATYLWMPGGATTQTITISPASTTPYTLTVSLPGCGSSNASQLVIVNPLPTVNAGIDQSICTGGTVTLSGSGGTTYSWNNNVSNGVAFTPLATATYTVSTTDANGCTNTDQVLVTVNLNPTVNGGNDQTVCVGGSAILSGSGASTYTWSGGVTNGVAFTPTVTSTYTVTGTNAAGCSATDQVTINVTAGPVAAIAGGAAVCLGNQVTLTASPVGATYLWMPGGATTQTLTVSPTSTTSYTLTVSLPGCGSSNATQSVTVNPLPTVNAGIDQSTCAGGTVTLSGSGGVLYTWDNSVSNGVAFTPLATATYTVSTTNANGCTNTDQVLVTVNPIPTVNGGNDQTVCVGGTATLSGSGASTYTWSGGVANGVAFTPTVTSTYTVTGTSAAGCVGTDQVTINVTAGPVAAIAGGAAVCLGSPVTLTASPVGATYLWMPGGATTQTLTVSPTSTTSYTLTVSLPGCGSSNATQSVTVNPLPTVNAGIDQSTCAGGTVTLSGSGGVLYTWDNSVSNGVAFTPLATATYTVSTTNANGCTNTDQVLVTVNPIPTVNGGNDQTVCVGGTATLSGSGASTYTWSGGVTNGVAFTPTVTSTYTVTGTSAAGCVGTDQVTINVTAGPVAAISGAAPMCLGSQVTLTASPVGVTYLWMPGGATTQNITVSPTSTTTYTLTVSLAGCGSSNATQSVVVNPAPTANYNDEACETYTWFGSTYTQSGTYTHLVPSPAGCDSVLYLNLTIHNNVVGNTEVVAACDNYQWNGQTYNQSGIYTYNGLTIHDCDSSATLDLTINSAPTASITAIGNTLSTTQVAGETYAWLDCATNTLLPNETAISYTPSTSGSYAVIATNSCGIDTSFCEDMIVGITDLDLEQISIYPNPSNGIFQVYSKREITLLEILDLKGAVIYSSKPNDNLATLDLRFQADGIYVLKLRTPQNTSYFRIVKN